MWNGGMQWQCVTSPGCVHYVGNERRGWRSYEARRTTSGNRSQRRVTLRTLGRGNTGGGTCTTLATSRRTTAYAPAAEVLVQDPRCVHCYALPELLLSFQGGRWRLAEAGCQSPQWQRQSPTIRAAPQLCSGSWSAEESPSKAQVQPLGACGNDTQLPQRPSPHRDWSPCVALAMPERYWLVPLDGGGRAKRRDVSAAAAR